MLYSVGHSTLDETSFASLIEPLDVIIDVRSHPTSKWPQFRKEHLETWLPRVGKKYEWEPGLGGWTEKHLPLTEQFKNVDIPVYAKGKFPKQRIGKTLAETPLLDQKPSWTNVGLLDYSYFMMLPEFQEAAKRVIERGGTENLGLMCCELLWWKCHRSMIADFIVWAGSDIIHLQPKLTYHSKCIGNRLERYEPEVISSWKTSNSTSASFVTTSNSAPPKS